MHKIRRELRRVYYQVSHQVQHRRINPYRRTRRANKPLPLRERPELEIDSALEFVALSVAQRVEDFFFLHIGAYDGAYQDPLPAMAIRHGWRGVMVEPQPPVFERLRENFAGQAERWGFENTAVAAESGEMTFYTTRHQSSHVASFDRGNLLRRGVAPEDIVGVRVPTVTVEDLLARHGAPHAHLIQIDAEGYDGQIIRSIDLTRMRPEIIRYEHVNLFPSERAEVIEHLASHGYRFMLENADTIAFYDSFNG